MTLTAVGHIHDVKVTCVTWTRVCSEVPRRYACQAVCCCGQAGITLIIASAAGELIDDVEIPRVARTCIRCEGPCDHTSYTRCGQRDAGFTRVAARHTC